MVRFDLNDKVALVTGASRGIGKAIALGLAEAGANVVMASRTLSDLEKVAKEISLMGKRSMPVATDVSIKDEIESLVAKTLDEFGQIDILVNDAAINPERQMLDIEEETWNETMAVNLRGYFLVCQAVGRSMVKRKTGNIINIASLIGYRPGPFTGHGVYSISKAGVIMLTMVLAKEWGQYGIRVNAIAPGVTETDMIKSIFSDPKARSQFIQATALRRITQPQDIAATAIFLASEMSNSMTGQVIVVDAGEGV